MRKLKVQVKSLEKGDVFDCGATQYKPEMVERKAVVGVYDGQEASPEYGGILIETEKAKRVFREDMIVQLQLETK